MLRKFGSSKISAPFIILALSLLIFLFSIFGDKGYIEYRLLQSREEKLLEEISKLENQRLIWKEKVYSLHTNNSYYENLAREKLGYLRKNEVMIELEYQ